MNTDSQLDTTTQPHDCLAGGGEMGALMRSLDWAATPLGPAAAWPQSLKTSVSICLNSGFPLLVWWGKDLVKLYNDAYRPLIGDKHPAAMGQAGRVVWPEIWDIIGPMLRGVLETGIPTRSEDLLLFLERRGYPEECYFTFSYSPIRDETGGVGGVFTPRSGDYGKGHWGAAITDIARPCRAKHLGNGSGRGVSSFRRGTGSKSV